MDVVLLTIGILVWGVTGSSQYQNNCNSFCPVASLVLLAAPSYKKDCEGIEYDIHEAVCCKNSLHIGSGLACCGKQSYNPAEATCCEEEHGHKVTANITSGLSQSISSCCGLTAYNPLNEICCNSTIHAKPAVHAECCEGGTFDADTHLCCGPLGEKILVKRESGHHLCCGKDQYDTKTQCCCEVDYVLQTRPIGSKCCDKVGSVTALCGQNKTYNTQNQLCCNSTIVPKPTPQTKCCGTGTFDADTQCCCQVDYVLQTRPIGSECCDKVGSGAHPQNHGPNNLSTTPHTGHHVVCLESPWYCTSGQPDVIPTVCSPRTHVCCRSGRRPSHDQLCGGTWAILTQGRDLSCDQILHKGGKDENKCPSSSVSRHLAAGTVCCSRFHSLPGEHCCGTELYQPHREICCSGHRYLKVKNVHCCGVEAYNIKSREMKCCAGRLHTLPNQSAREARCCGSLLQKPSDVCCTSENEEVLYPSKPGFRCCGHLYFNTSLWSCCEGRLSPVHNPHQHHSGLTEESRLLSLNNLGVDDLCGEMHAGIVESVSLHSIVFRSVVKLQGRDATVEHLPSTYILSKPAVCSFPKLIPGETYFFSQVFVFIDFNHDSILESLHFILSRCFPSQASSD